MFWEDLGRVKSLISHFVRYFFVVIFEARFEEAKNCKQNAPRAQKTPRKYLGCGGPGPPGENKRGVIRSQI